ncbi:hypothetical protein F4821DRAFT_264274 [Hypoxylon rubiginosum]|uniref:Uncharacterized protein n=1 Tax=Hypoxylon rubiginosum TaxID=110542 RepID=A0ACC0CNY8_9PEZI|nr:hypothetical protein F4821DRAFT_264274 [Hypoxylon rubiginosum]
MTKILRSIGLKLYLHRNATKLLDKTLGKPPVEKVRVRIRNTNPALATASSKVGSIAALAVLNVIKAQAGASTTAAVALYAAECISSCFKVLTEGIPDAIRTVLLADAMEYSPLSLQPLKRLTSLFIDLSPTRTIDRARVVAHRVRGSLSGHQANATVAAIAAAQMDVIGAVTDVIFDYIATTEPTDEDALWSLKKLAFAMIEAASQGAAAVAQSVAMVTNQPPPYRERE